MSSTTITESGDLKASSKILAILAHLAVSEKPSSQTNQSSRIEQVSPSLSLSSHEGKQRTDHLLGGDEFDVGEARSHCKVAGQGCLATTDRTFEQHAHQRRPVTVLHLLHEQLACACVVGQWHKWRVREERAERERRCRREKVAFSRTCLHDVRKRFTVVNDAVGCRIRKLSRRHTKGRWHFAQRLLQKKRHNKMSGRKLASVRACVRACEGERRTL